MTVATGRRLESYDGGHDFLGSSEHSPTTSRNPLTSDSAFLPLCRLPFFGSELAETDAGEACLSWLTMTASCLLVNKPSFAFGFFGLTGVHTASSLSSSSALESSASRARSLLLDILQFVSGGLQTELCLGTRGDYTCSVDRIRSPRTLEATRNRLNTAVST